MPAAKLSRVQLDLVFARIKQGESVYALARECGIQPPNLYRRITRVYGHRFNPKNAPWAQKLFLPDDPAILGYIAGVIDGEGSIMLRKDGYWHITVGNTHQGLLQWLATFGGAVYQQRLRPRRQPFSTWSVSRRRDILALLKAILPYLIIKRDKAQQAIAAIERML